jgi:hypothetical protein
LRVGKNRHFIVGAIDSVFAVCSSERMDLLFKVVEVAPSGDRIIAAADNLMVARAAFDTAVARRRYRTPAKGAGGSD